jgi:DNA-binding MarR family transcriptional regulator
MHYMIATGRAGMTIERDIVENCACHRVRMAARSVTRAYDDALRPVGLRSTQFSLLVAVAIDGAISITALANFLGMDRSTLTRNLGPLVDDELISVGLEGWRRSRTIEITKKGRARVREALPHWKRAQGILRQKLGDPDWAALRDVLDRVIHAT